jgi:hypothetical protein
MASLMQIGALDGRLVRRPAKIVTLAVAVLLLMTIAAPAAHATLRIENHTDPAGDPTVMTYNITRADQTWTSGDFTLDAIEWYRSFGQPGGTVAAPVPYVVQAKLPAGWQVADIQCLGSGRPGEFSVDVANGRVTMNHVQGDEQTCAFTDRRISSSGGSSSGSGGSGSGITPTLPPAQLSKVALPNRPALLRVTTGRRFATATVRVIRRSTIKGQLLWHNHVVGSARVVHRAGTYQFKVSLSKSGLRMLRRHHLKRPKLTLRVVVVAGKSTRVFKIGALVRL